MSSRSFSLSTLVLLVFHGFIDSAMGGISTVSGDVLIIDPPESVALSSLEDDFLVKLFPEQQSVFLEEELSIDVSEPGLVGGVDDLTAATVVGEQVNSYFLHVDPIDNGHPPKEYNGEIIFTEEILGIILDGKTLDASDLILGAIETSYAPKDIFRGFEGPGFPANGRRIKDSLELMADLRTVSVHFMTTSKLDQVRIVTRSPEGARAMTVPEPISASLLATGFLLLVNQVRSP